MDEYVTLNNGRRMPRIGFCTYSIPVDGMTHRSVQDALRLGYRFIDTAASYYNEAEVGSAVNESGLSREDVFVATKLAPGVSGYDAVREAIAASLEKMGLDYLDLYTVEQPDENFAETWRALEDAYSHGLIQSLGAAHVAAEEWDDYIEMFSVVPAVLLAECHPYYQRQDLREKIADKGVYVIAQSPESFWNAELASEPIIIELSEKYDKTENQVILRFGVQDGLVVLPKPSTPARIARSLQIFDFALTGEEMDALRALNRELAEGGPPVITAPSFDLYGGYDEW